MRVVPSHDDEKAERKKVRMKKQLERQYLREHKLGDHKVRDDSVKAAADNVIPSEEIEDDQGPPVSVSDPPPSQSKNYAFDRIGVVGVTAAVGLVAVVVMSLR